MSADMDELIEKAVSDLLDSDALTANTDGSPTFFWLDAENVTHLVRTILEAIGLPALLEDNEQLRVSVNRQFGEPLDEVYKTDGITIVMQRIHDLRTDRDALAAKVADVRTVLAEIDGYGWNTGRAVRLRAALTGDAS